MSLLPEPPDLSTPRGRAQRDADDRRRENRMLILTLDTVGKAVRGELTKPESDLHACWAMLTDAQRKKLRHAFEALK